jgi:hypothetical protein
VTRIHPIVVGQRQQLSGDAGDQGIVIAAGQVGASDRSGKQHIAHKSGLMVMFL